MNQFDEYLSLIKNGNLDEIKSTIKIINTAELSDFLVINAIKYNNLEILKYFFSIGGLISIYYKNKMLAIAIKTNKITIVKYLVENCIIYKKFTDNNRYEYLPCLSNLEILKYLINTVENFDINTILYYCELSDENYDGIEYLVKNYGCCYNNHLFNRAIDNNKIKYVKLIFETFHNIINQNIYVNLINKNRFEIFKYLVDNDTKIDLYKIMYETICENGFKYMEYILINHSIVDDKDVLLLHAITMYHHTFKFENEYYEIIKLLLNYGADESSLSPELKTKLRNDKIKNISK